MAEATENLVDPRVDAPAVEQRPAYVCDPCLAFVTPRLKKVLQVWEAKRGGRTMPCRADFDLRDLSFAAPNVAFVAVVRDEARMRFQIQMMGTQLDSYVGPMTGKFIDEALPKALVEKWSRMWGSAVEMRRAERWAGRVEVSGKNGYAFEKLSAPLGRDGERPDGLLIATYFHLWHSDQHEIGEAAQSLLGEIEAATR